MTLSHRAGHPICKHLQLQSSGARIWQTDYEIRINITSATFNTNINVVQGVILANQCLNGQISGDIKWEPMYSPRSSLDPEPGNPIAYQVGPVRSWLHWGRGWDVLQPIGLRDLPLKDPNAECLTYCSILIKEGEWLMGYSMMTLNPVIETKPLPKGTLAQKAELITITWALQLATRICVNIYTDCKYALTTLHIHGALYKEKGLTNSEEKDIKYDKEILKLLYAVWAPKRMTVVHYCGHQKRDTPPIA